MAIGNAVHRRESLTAAEVESIESVLRQKGYHLVEKANEGELLPGEYLKRQRSSFVYAYASPVAWEYAARVLRTEHGPKRRRGSTGGPAWIRTRDQGIMSPLL
jgi:hypothetical protein